MDSSTAGILKEKGAPLVSRETIKRYPHASMRVLWCHVPGTSASKTSEGLFKLPAQASARKRKNLANQQQSSVRQSISSDPKTSEDQEARTDVRGASSVHGCRPKISANRFKTRAPAGVFVPVFIRDRSSSDKQVVADPDRLKNSVAYLDWWSSKNRKQVVA